MKIIQIIQTNEAGLLALTDEGTILRLCPKIRIDNRNEVAFFDDEVVVVDVETSKACRVKNDQGPCYRCHQWPCKCPEGPLMKKPNEV